VSASRLRLGPTSYVVLGTLAVRGPSTPYELKKFVEAGVGFLWQIPHTQLYTEPRRLAEAGLLHEEREEDGRQRRTFSLADPGRTALGEWLADPVSENSEVRDLALLKVFFASEGDRDDLPALARSQVAAHEARLAQYEAIERRYQGRGAYRQRLSTLRFGILFEQAALQYWRELVTAEADAR
jgi:PadR family transcriptional regulator, regulatory protein AphA